MRLEAVQQLTVETEAEGSVRLQWRRVPGVRGYRVVWGPFTGKSEIIFLAYVLLTIAPPISSDFFSPNASICCFFLVSSHKGRDVETVELAGDTAYHTLSNLRHDTEYIVTIIPLYNGNTEGPVATARFKIGLFVLLSD